MSKYHDSDPQMPVPLAVEEINGTLSDPRTGVIPGEREERERERSSHRIDSRCRNRRFREWYSESRTRISRYSQLIIIHV